MSRRLLLLLLAVVLLTSPPVGLSQTGAVSPLPDIGLGFGPLSIVPISTGIPVFGPGDGLWIQSFYNSTVLSVFVDSPNGPIGAFTLQPGSLIRLHSFAPGDPTGAWILGTFDFASTTSSQLTFNYENNTEILTPGYAGANVTRNNLDLEFVLPSTPAYYIQACALGASPGPSTRLPLPGVAGDSVEVSLNGSTALVSASVGTPLPAWFEVYTPRYYVNGTALLSDETLAAQTSVVSVGGQPGTTTIPLAAELNLRVGRYDLRSYVREPSGLLSYDTPYLKLNGSAWISLAGCAQLRDVASSTFVVTSSLDEAETTWPREVYTMYAVNGLDSVSVSDVPVMPARIDLRGSGPSQKLVGVNATVTGGGVQAWDSYNGSVYLLGNSFPLQVSIALSFEGVTTSTLNATIEGPYSHVALKVSAGQLLVQTSFEGAPLAKVTTYVSSQGLASRMFKTGGAGSLSLTLPPGQYNVTSAYGGSTVTEVVSVSPGSTTVATLDLGPQSNLLLILAFAAALIAAVGLNLVVWRGYRRRKTTLESRSHDPGRESHGTTL